MYRVIECLTQEHNYWLVGLAALVCVIGSSLSVLLLRRVLVSQAQIRATQVGLSAIMTGVTIWATHFIAMLAYDPGLPHAYEPAMTIVSLAIAALGTLAANIMMAYLKKDYRFLISGLVFGATVCGMHYTGMSAYILPGRPDWNASAVATSVLLGAAFGGLSYHRIAYPVTRICWLGAALSMVLAICTMHFFGMSAFTIVESPLLVVPDQAISDTALGLVVISITLIIFLIGFASLNIEQSIANQAHTELQSAVLKDVLTGLPNRHALHLALDRWTAKLTQDPTDQAAAITFNIDGFRHINELHGRATGDQLLIIAGQRIREELQPNDALFRADGDEFVVLSGGVRRIGQVSALADRITGYLNEGIEIDGIALLISFSAGIACSLSDGRDVEILVQKSGVALAQAKSYPDVKTQIFDADMQNQSRSRLELQSDLRNAADKGEFELVYQKQNALPSRDLVGFEVLLRWNHPVRGRVSPGEFIPVAEQTGMIRDIGLWVMRTACEEAARWPVPMSVAVNVAPQQLIQPSFVESVSDILFETRLPPERLELEITEASIIDDAEHTLRVMHRLKVMGLRIAMDDFGTGYSSLAALQSFPFDKIKIDRSFVQDVHLNTQRAAIVRATVLIGKALEIPVLAEGAELEEEVDFLTKEGCGYVQGFYFGTPLPLDAVHETIAEMVTKKAS